MLFPVILLLQTTPVIVPARGTPGSPWLLPAAVGDSARKTEDGGKFTDIFGLVPRPGATDENGAEIVATCGHEHIAGVKELLAQDAALVDSINWTREVPGTWTTLACVRAALSTTPAHERDEILMLGGTSWAQGAVNTLLHEVKAHRMTQQTVDLLALLSMRDRFQHSGGDIRKAIRAAVDSGMISSPVLRACTMNATAQHEGDQVQRCAGMALAHGWDSTWHLVHLARDRFLHADTVTGRKDFLAAVGAAHDTVSRAEITWQLQWFLSANELTRWPTLADSERVHQVDSWMFERDVRDGRPQGARVAEHFLRLDYVEKSFATVRPKLNSVMAGSHASMGGDPNDWHYPGEPKSPYVRWQNDFDDRGVVYMRLGMPTRIDRTWNIQTGSASDTWFYPYVINNCQVELHFRDIPFDGNAGATRLASGCGLGLATRFDDNGIHPKHDIRVSGAFHRLWDPVTGAPVALIPYAVPLKDLARKNSADRRSATMELTVREWDPRLDIWHDTTITKVLVIPKGAHGDLFSGFLTVPTTPTTASWSLVAEQPPDRWGRRTETGLASIATDSLQLSDLVFGARSQGITWRRGDEVVPLGPQGNFSQAEPLNLFFQILATRARPEVSMTVAIFPGKGGRVVAGQKAALEITTREKIAAGLHGLTRTIGISRLGAGEYMVQVTLTDPAGEILARQSAPLTIRPR